MAPFKAILRRDGNRTKNATSTSSTYRLQRYSLRTSLSIIGPLFLVAFYIVICYYYLSRTPVNDIISDIPKNPLDARWVFYAWFIISIFVLDWARSGLGNIEAAALMKAKFAPTTAMELMWHADGNWANFLWWLRGLRSLLVSFSGRLRSRTKPRVSESRPGLLWWFLSATTLLLFVAIPISGLSMELTTASIRTTSKAFITGPGPETFNLKGIINLPQTIRGRWRGGASTTPTTAAILYAPDGTFNASTTYFNDLIHSSNLPTSVKIFAGPAVNEEVVGNAWGVEASINCKKVHQHELQLIQVKGFADYLLVSGWENGKPTFAKNPSTDFDLNAPTTAQLQWVNETGVWDGKVGYSLVVISEGTWEGRTPYDDASGFDLNTLSGQQAIAAQSQADRAAQIFPDKTTTSSFEAYLWQAFNTQYPDEAMNELLHDTSGYIDTLDKASFASFPGANVRNFSPTRVAGFGIHCDVTSAVGNADLDPAHRTYSSFKKSIAATQLGQDVDPLQMEALEAIGSYEPILSHMSFHDPTGPDSTWLAAHLAIGLLPYQMDPPSDSITSHVGPTPYFPALTPDNMTLAMYKILGESLIAIMDQGGQEAWKGDLYSLASIRFLKPGVVPWQLVLVLLALWAVIVVTASTWMAFTKRWAPTLGGFELFRFGAQYTDEINRFEDRRFEGCGTLRNIPGMVGLLGGDVKGGTLGFVGLSESQADPKTEYAFSRSEAGRSKAVV